MLGNGPEAPRREKAKVRRIVEGSQPLTEDEAQQLVKIGEGLQEHLAAFQDGLNVYIRSGGRKMQVFF